MGTIPTRTANPNYPHQEAGEQDRDTPHGTTITPQSTFKSQRIGHLVNLSSEMPKIGDLGFQPQISSEGNKRMETNIIIIFTPCLCNTNSKETMIWFVCNFAFPYCASYTTLT